MPKSLEEIYDGQISPLMHEIIEICREHGIPFVAIAQLTNAEDPLLCSTLLPQPWQADVLDDVHKAAMHKPKKSTMSQPYLEALQALVLGELSKGLLFNGIGVDYRPKKGDIGIAFICPHKGLRNVGILLDFEQADSLIGPSVFKILDGSGRVTSYENAAWRTISSSERAKDRSRRLLCDLGLWPSEESVE